MERFYRFSFLVLASLTFVFAAQCQVSLNNINVVYSQNFDTLANAGTSSLTPLGWQYLETGTNANGAYTAGTGSSNTGDSYSFGVAGSSERAMGGLRSGSLVPLIGASFVNNTGTTITALEILYFGEQWRLGTLGRTDRLDFQYSLNATSLNTGTWIDVDELDFLAPLNSGTTGAKVGNTFRVHQDDTIHGLNIPDSAIFFLRWVDVDVTGADDGLSVDDFWLRPMGTPPDQPAIILSPASINFGSVNVNESDTASYLVDGNNLTDSIAISHDNTRFSLSIDGISYSASVKLPADGGRVTVRFSPIADGGVTDSVRHTSGATSAILQLSGSGFNQADHIIPVATARAQAPGTIVTVAGRITVGLEHGNPSFIQDASGGIPVFDFALSHAVEIGDTAIVTGPIGVFNQMKQISGAGIFFTIPDSSSRVPAPMPISIGSLAAHEGRLVTVQGVELVNKAFVFYPQSTERMTNGTIQADLRIDGDTNIPGFTKPQGVVDITGVVGRFNTNAQLLPRFISDIPGASSPATPADSIPRSRTLDIVNWNIEFFGATFEDYGEEFGPANEALQLQNVKTVMNSLNADIIAVEEVSSDSTFALLVSQMPGKAYVCSDRWSHFFDDDGTFPPQKVCFVYDTATVQVLSARPMFRELYDAERETPNLLADCPGGAESFYSSGRLPYLLSTRVTIEGVTEDVSLVVVHAKSGATANDRNRRLYDGEVLKDSLDAHYPNARIIYLGDLNDDLDTSIVVGAVTPYKNFVNDTAQYNPITLPLSNAGARSTVSFQDVIDHQIISNEMTDLYIPGSAQIVAPFGLVSNYANTTSDHLPVISRYLFTPTIASFEQDGLVVTEDSVSGNVLINFSKPFASTRQITIEVAGGATYGTDYITSPAAEGGSVVIDVPAGSTSAQFNFTILADDMDELLETATFTLQTIPGIELGNPSVFSLAIEDNDVPTISFASVFDRAMAGSGPHRIGFNLSTPPATDQHITLRVLDGHLVDYGDDYVTDPQVVNQMIQVSIPAGSTEASFELTPLVNKRRRFPFKLITFQLVQASPGLTIVDPRFSIFSIINKKREPHFVVFPNPTRGQLQIASEELEPGESFQATLRNNNGNSLRTMDGTLDQISEAVASVLNGERRGFYTLSIVVDGETFVLRIMKI